MVSANQPLTYFLFFISFKLWNDLLNKMTSSISYDKDIILIIMIGQEMAKMGGGYLGLIKSY